MLATWCSFGSDSRFRNFRDICSRLWYLRPRRAYDCKAIHDTLQVELVHVFVVQSNKTLVVLGVEKGCIQLHWRKNIFGVGV